VARLERFEPARARAFRAGCAGRLGGLTRLSGAFPPARRRPPRSSNLPLRSKKNVARLERFEPARARAFRAGCAGRLDGLPRP